MKNTNTLAVVIGVSGLILAASAPASIVPVSSSRMMSVSRFLQMPGQDYVQDYDQWEHPNTPSPFAPGNRSVEVTGAIDNVYQHSTASQHTDLANGEKVLDVSTNEQVTPGEWSRGLSASGGAGALSSVTYTGRVDSATRVYMTIYAYGDVSSNATVTGVVSLSRNNHEMFYWSVPPTYDAFQYSYATLFDLAPGVWEFNVYLNGYAQGGPSTGVPRSGELALNFGVTEIPSLSGSAVLALAGLGAAVRRRRR